MRAPPSFPASFPTSDQSPVPRASNNSPLIPPTLGLVRLPVPGFARLSVAEQMQASVLALNRDLSVSSTTLRLAVAAAPDSADEALVAYYIESSTGEKPQVAPSTRLLGAMQPGVVYWVDAPLGFIVGERGAAVVESAAGNDRSLPSVVAATIASASTPAPRCILVNRDRSEITDDTVAHWAAASGVEMFDGALPASPSLELVSPPRVRDSREATGLDRALLWSAISAVACAAIAGVQFAGTAATPATQGTVDGKRSQSTAGALFARIATIAPDATGQLQAGTYAGGAWVLTVPDTVDPATMLRMTRALETNGLAAQSTAAPGPRLRVQLP